MAHCNFVTWKVGGCLQTMNWLKSAVPPYISITPDGYRAALSNWEDKNISIWNIMSGKETAYLTCETNNEEAMPRFIFSPDAKLVVGEGSGDVNIYDLKGFD